MARFGPLLALCALPPLVLPPSAHAQTFVGPGFALVDATPEFDGGVFGEIVLSGTGKRVAALERITISGLEHARIGDLAFSLIHSASGSMVPIWAPAEAWEAGFNGDYSLVPHPRAPTVDAVAASLGAGDTLPGGVYAPSVLGVRRGFDAFQDISLDSTWLLGVFDHRIGESGAVTGWSITVRTYNGPGEAPEPGSVALIAVGVSGLIVLRLRRR